MGPYMRRLLSGTAAIALVAYGAGVARAAKTDLNLPAQPLDVALTSVGAQTGSEILFSKDLVIGRKAPALKGTYEPREALAAVLSGTNLRIASTADNVYVITPPPATQHDTYVRVAAADSSGRAQPGGVETVVVTAQRREENIQNVPIAMTALSQKELTIRQIAGGPDLIKEVPNLTFSKTNFTGYNLEIRGIGTQAISVATDPAVSVAFNGTGFLRNHFFEQEFYDLENAQVLRGPQGTLFGRNSNAGVVNIVSAKPTDHFEAMGSLDFGNFNNRRMEGMINIPIVGDKLDIRMAGEWTKRDGYSFNDTTNKPIDGRDLWSGRLSIGFRPTENFHADFIWEHFSETDDRLRSSKQLCETDPGLTSVTAADGTIVPVVPASGNPFAVNAADFSQGCLPTSLYSANAFQVPNGWSLPFAAGASFLGIIHNNIDPYSQTTQSTDLRHIQSVIAPNYKAKNDTLEFNQTWNATPALTLHSDTGYNNDFLWSSEDYNRFDTSPGIFIPGAVDPGVVDANGVFCDPQLGCSDRLVIQDLATERSWQLSQEFRAESDFTGPFNFSAGANYLHYQTVENYYVFSNSFTLIALDNCFPQPYVPGVTTHLTCLPNGRSYNNQLTAESVGTESPQYIDPNPITSLDNHGHNYFVSQNPYILNSYAVFGEAYYQVTNDLKLTGGLRWTDDEKHFVEIPSEVLVKGYGYPSTGTVDQKWNQWTGRFVANWTPKLPFTDQSMFYASFAHGYKAGGANPPGPILINADVSGPNIQFPVHPLTFKPEFINAYELGTKNALLDGSLIIDADVFHYDYKAYQISQIVDRTSVNLNFDATISGAEIQTTWSPLEGLNLGFNGGYETTRIDNNQFAIDLIDRTAGHPGWVVMKPSIGQSSNCIIPEYVAAALIQQTAIEGFGEGNPEVAACGTAYFGGLDPVTRLPYVANPTITASGASTPPGYPGFDPTTAPNNGEGFAKNVGGNQLPNAPHFTVSFTADYTMPVSPSWAATLHGDFYHQTDSMARVFNDKPYDQIHGYSNVNLALILNDATGWQAMAYVKNVLDTTAITGDFLNSDDSGLTTNVFLTDPRLYGLRVTKRFGEGDWSHGGGLDFIPEFFADTDGKPPSLWLQLGGDFAQLDDSWQKFAPPFTAIIPSGLPSPVTAEKAPKASFDWEGKLSFRPEDSDWVVTAAIRYGRSSSNTHLHKSLPPATKTSVSLYSGGAAIPCGLFGGCPFVAGNNEFVDADTTSSERHMILDFTAGKDVGIGLFGGTSSGTLGGGVRFAQFDTHAMAELSSDPLYNFNAPPTMKYRNVYDDVTKENRSFHGIGPKVTWDAMQPVLGNVDDGQVALDWGLSAAVLFGRQSAALRQTLSHRCGGSYAAYGISCPNHYSSTKTIKRSRSVTVPNLGGYMGLSMNYKNAKVSFGYRADEFFGAMDGGQDAHKTYNRAFYGPYVNFSIGMGG